MASREGRRFEFGWLELLGLILVFAAGSVVVFFLGIFVGKGLQESQLQREERIVRLPVNPGADARSDVGRDNELRLTDELSRGGPAVTPGVNLAVRRSPETSPAADPLRVATAPTAAVPTAIPTAAPRATAEQIPSEDITRSAPVPSPATRLGERSEEGAAGRRGWSVQVNATRDEATANGLVRKLQERGYNAYVVRVGLQGDTWYRVRVGRFPTMEAATAVVVRLKNEERYSRAFLVND